MAEKIRIGFVDFWKGFDARNNCLTDMLIRIYGKNRIEVVDKNFDYLFFSCFGHSNLKYDCIKIFFTGENIVPDFNICDYAIGVHEMNLATDICVYHFITGMTMLMREPCKNINLRILII